MRGSCAPRCNRWDSSARRCRGFRKLTICYRFAPDATRGKRNGRTCLSALVSEDEAINGDGREHIETEIDSVEPNSPLRDAIESNQQECQRHGLEADQRRRKYRANRHVLVDEKQFGVIFEQVLESGDRQQNAE